MGACEYNAVSISTSWRESDGGSNQADDMGRFAVASNAEPKNLLGLHAVARDAIRAVALSRDVVPCAHHIYSHLIETSASV